MAPISFERLPNDVVVIEGRKYSGSLFRHFAHGGNSWFRVVKREEDGAITFESERGLPVVLTVPEIKNCARCGCDHAAIPFHKFTHPPGDSTHFGTCPATDEPILLSISETPE